MTTEWSDWTHVMWSTRGHWLPGDPRGFRDHDHRVHSSGDYRNPPPKGEHAGLYRYSRRIALVAVRLTVAQRARAGERMLVSLRKQGLAARAFALGAMHAHTLIRVSGADARTPIGIAKQVASRSMCREVPGRMWGQRCHVVRIRDYDYYRNVVRYILAPARKGAWVWEPERFRAPGAPP